MMQWCFNLPVSRFLLLAIGFVLSVQFVLPAYAKMPVAEINGNRIKVEVASTQAEIEHGLMYRTALPEDNGMVFLYHPPMLVKFWMAHCFISLDMIFIKDGKIVKICQDVPPCKAALVEDCPTYPAGPPIAVTEVLEVSAGYCKRHNIVEGDTVQFTLPNSTK